MPLLVLIFYSIPESILIFTFGFVIFRIKIDSKKIIVAAIISALISYLVRMLPIPFGFHMIIGVLVLTLLFRYICKFGFGYSILATLLSLSTLLALESIFSMLPQYIFNMTSKEILEESAMFRLMFGLPQLIALALITFILYKKKINISGKFVNG